MAETGELLTIEQLAARTGLSVRNIRSHVTRGLLPAPHLQGRTGYYGEEHVARLELISGLQAQGFNLAAVTRLVNGPVAPSAEQTVEFYRTALGAWLTEPAEVWQVDELAATFGEDPDPERVALLHELGVVEPLDTGQVRVLNPSLLRIGKQVLSLGFGVESLLRVLGVLVSHSRAVSESLVSMFLATHWEPYVAAGQPPDELPSLSGVIEALQPLASQAVMAAFGQAMTESVNQAFERISDSMTAASPAPATA